MIDFKRSNFTVDYGRIRCHDVIGVPIPCECVFEVKANVLPILLKGNSAKNGPTNSPQQEQQEQNYKLKRMDKSSRSTAGHERKEFACPQHGRGHLHPQ